MELHEMPETMNFPLGQEKQNESEPSLLPDLTMLSDEAAERLLARSKKLVGSIIEYKELMMMYTCAMKAIRTKFEVLNTEFNVRYSRNPISAINTRLKKTSSIIEKLIRLGHPFSPECIETYLHDVAGVRIICSYIDDIYRIADAFLRQDDITLITAKDYIEKPKENGYRSLHLIVSVPVFFADRKRDMKVEVQIRTVAMDYWAGLEHQLKYKREIPEEEDIIAQLKDCAERLDSIDRRMQNIRRQIDSGKDIPSEDDILFEKIGKLDISII